MKLAAILGISIILTGCASEPMTDEQRQMAFQYLMARQANQPAPYVAPMPVAPARPTNCISNQSGSTVYTNCN